MALPTHGASLNASTINDWCDGWRDQVFHSNPFINACKTRAATQGNLPAQDRSYREINGGQHIQDTALLGTRASTQWTNSSEPVEVDETEVLIQVQWPWSMGVNNCMLSDFDDARNAGSSAKNDVWGSRIYAAGEQTAFDTEARMMSETAYLTGVSGEVGPNSIGGLLAADPTTGTVGGINRANYANWRNVYEDGIGAFATYYYKLNTHHRTCRLVTKRRFGWDLVVMGTTIAGAIEAFFQNKGEFLFQQKENPDLGVSTFYYKGAPCIDSSDCAADNLYGINTHGMVYAVNTQMNMKVKDVDGGPSVNAEVRKIQHMCQLFFRSFKDQAMTGGWS